MNVFICVYFSICKKDPLATPVMERFAVKFQIYTKVIKVHKLAPIYDEIKHVFSFLQSFPEKLIVKYKDKNLSDVGLDR